MNINKVHCLFEQSGSFKSAFNNIGFEAFDYDIENRFGETDFIVDIFNEIDKAYNDEVSIFDEIDENDLIVSFFPCTYFSVQSELLISGKAYNFRKMNDETKRQYINNRIKKREQMFSLLLKYIDVCKKKNLRMIFENPYKGSYLLTRDEIKQPDIVIMNRSLLGDDHIKPTGFWFYNLQPTFMSEFIQLNNSKLKIHNQLNGIDRSTIHKDFAFNFINKFIIGTI